MKSKWFGRVWKTLGAIALIAIVVWFVTWDEGAETTAADENRFETKPATVETLEELVSGSFTFEERDAKTAIAAVQVSGVVTDIAVEKGDKIEPLQHLMDVDGEPVYVVIGGVPVYREITSRTKDGDDIRTLEDNLVAAGYEVGEVDGKADRDLRDALKEWQEAEDLKETGVFNPLSFVWLPEGFVVENVLVEQGEVVSFQTPVIETTKTGNLMAVARIEQADITKIRQDLDVDLTLDGIPEIDLSGTVLKIEDEPFPGTSEFLVEIRVNDLPSQVRKGMKGEAEVLVSRQRDVLVVPTGAVGGPAGAPTVRVLVDGRVEVRTIKVGLVTPADTVVVSGVSAGELIIVAENEV